MPNLSKNPKCQHYTFESSIEKLWTPWFPASAPPKSVTAVSPDDAQDQPLKFSFEGGILKVIVPQLESYTALIVE
jgi:hypothetical protein